MDLRRESRIRLRSYGQYRRGHGRAYKVLFEDISEYGCCFHDLVGRLERGMTLTVRVGGIGPIEAHVRWNEKRVIGLEFDQPLHPAVLDHITRNHPEAAQT